MEENDERDERYVVWSGYVSNEWWGGTAYCIWDTLLQKKVGNYDFTFILDEDDVKPYNEQWRRELDAAKEEKEASFFSNFHNLSYLLTGSHFDYIFKAPNKTEMLLEKEKEIKKINEIQKKRSKMVCELSLRLEGRIKKELSEYNDLVSVENVSRGKLKLPLMKQIIIVKDLIDAFKELVKSNEREWHRSCFQLNDKFYIAYR